MKKKPVLKPRSLGATSMIEKEWARSDYDAIGQAILAVYESTADGEFTVDCVFSRESGPYVCITHECPASWCLARAYVIKQAADKRWVTIFDRYNANDGGKK